MYVDTSDLEYRFNRKKAEGSTLNIYDGQMHWSIANGVLVKDKNAFSISFSCDEQRRLLSDWSTLLRVFFDEIYFRFGKP